MRYFVTFAASTPESPDSTHAIEVVTRGDGSVEARMDGKPIAVDVAEAGPALSVRVGHRVFDLWIDGHDGRSNAAGSARASFDFVASGTRGRAMIESERSRMAGRATRPGGGGGCSIRAPMPGRVIKLLVSEGEAVEAGTPVAVVEAMKMENELCADAPGVVRSIHVTAGQTVDGGATLVDVGLDDGASEPSP
jgi:biotin carboxyl carrier protein